MIVHDETLVSEAARLVGDSTIPADVRLAQLRELIGKDTRPRWRVTATVDKFDGDWTAEQIASGEAAEAFAGTHTVNGNLLTIGGASALWQLAFQASPAVSSFSSPYLGVGDGTTAAAQSNTDLAGTNKTRKAATVSHTDSTSSTAALTVTLVSTFGTSEANHRWREWGSFNASTAGRMLNRKVEDLDGGSAKTSAQSWQLTITISLA